MSSAPEENNNGGDDDNDANAVGSNVLSFDPLGNTGSNGTNKLKRRRTGAFRPTRTRQPSTSTNASGARSNSYNTTSFKRPSSPLASSLPQNETAASNPPVPDQSPVPLATFGVANSADGQRLGRDMDQDHRGSTTKNDFTHNPPGTTTTTATNSTTTTTRATGAAAATTTNTTKTSNNMLVRRQRHTIQERNVVGAIHTVIHATNTNTRDGFQEPASSLTQSARKVRRKKMTVGVTIGGSRVDDSTNLVHSDVSIATMITNNTTGPSNSVTLQQQQEHHQQQPFNAQMIQHTDEALIMDQQDAVILSQPVGDAPRLGSFCSSFRMKRSKQTFPPETDPNSLNATTTNNGNNHNTNHHRHNHHESVLSTHANNNDENDEYDSGGKGAGPVVQIIDGEIVLQESSLVVNGSTAARPEDEFSVVEEEAQLAVVGASYHSFTKRSRSKVWTVPETLKFFQALRQFGTDFGTMEHYFMHQRTRKQLKSKYQSELIKNPTLVERALDVQCKQQIDLSMFQFTPEEADRLLQKLEENDRMHPPKRSPSETEMVPGDEPVDDSVQVDIVEEDAEEERKGVIQSAPTMMNVIDDSVPMESTRPLFSAELPSSPTSTQIPPPRQLMNESLLMEDPLFGMEADEPDASAAAVISLVPDGVKKTKSKKPKFRSMPSRKKK